MAQRRNRITISRKMAIPPPPKTAYLPRFSRHVLMLFSVVMSAQFTVVLSLVIWQRCKDTSITLIISSTYLQQKFHLTVDRSEVTTNTSYHHGEIKLQPGNYCARALFYNTFPECKHKHNITTTNSCWF